jgi:mannitol-1-phosphate 5-dehydrogenase
VSASPFARELALIEKPQLLPFEEAKLYGHNATHALAAYLGQVSNVPMMADLRQVDGLLQWLFDAFIEESGIALIRKYEGLDPLFTLQGYADYAVDLLTRMTNPILQDSSARVGRDPKRKLGWHDRLVGTLRLALSQQLEANRYAFGCCAALDVLGETPDMLEALWHTEIDHDVTNEHEQVAVFNLIAVAWQRYQQWQAEGRPALDVWWKSVTS